MVTSASRSESVFTHANQRNEINLQQQLCDSIKKLEAEICAREVENAQKAREMAKPQKNSHSKSKRNMSAKAQAGVEKSRNHNAKAHQPQPTKISELREELRAMKCALEDLKKDMAIDEDLDRNGLFGSSMLGRAISAVTQAAAVPITLALKFATDHPCIAAAMLIVPQIVAATAMPVLNAQHINATREKMEAGQRVRTTQAPTETTDLEVITGPVPELEGHYGVEPETPAVGELKYAEDIQKGDKKFAVAVFANRGDNPSPICTGSAVSEDTIITAAHCLSFIEQGPYECRDPDGNLVEDPAGSGITYFDDYDDYDYDSTATPQTDAPETSASTSYSTTIETTQATTEASNITCGYAYEKFIKSPPQNITVLYGTEHGKARLFSRRFPAKDIRIHPNFNLSSGQHDLDIGLIRLQGSIKGIPVVKLATADIHAKLIEETQANGNGTNAPYKDNVFLQGWGDVENPDAKFNEEEGFWDFNNGPTKLATRLRQTKKTTVTVSVEDKEADCNVTLCTSDVKTNICPGDSGGPVIYFDRQTKVPYLVAVNSQTGLASMDCLGTDALHTRVFPHRNWLTQQLGQMRSNPRSNRYKAFEGQADKNFTDIWDSGQRKYTHFDCEPQKIADLKVENARQQALAQDCKKDPAKKINHACSERQARAMAFQVEVTFRDKNCRTTTTAPTTAAATSKTATASASAKPTTPKPVVHIENNKEGLIMKEKLDLEIGQRPVQASCVITNLNNVDVLKFMPSGKNEEAITIKPLETVSCPPDGQAFFTQGSVTRPWDQVNATEKAVAPADLKPADSPKEVFISVERQAKQGESFTPTKCEIMNNGTKPLKFQLQGQANHTRLMPGTVTECPGGDQNPNLDGDLRDPHTSQLPEQKFRLVGQSQPKQIGIMLDDQPETTGKAFLINDRHYMEHMGVLSSENPTVYIFQSNLGEKDIKTVRLVDKSTL